MNQEELKSIIAKGENLTVEFKSWIKTVNQKERIKLAVNELIAFANSKGGTVYFGIEDNGIVTGCNDYDIQNLIESIYDKTRPPLFVEAEEIEYEDKTVVALTVESDGNIYASSDGRCLKRLGKNSKPFYPIEMGNKLSRDAVSDYSSKLLMESTIEDINLLEVYNLKEKLKLRDDHSTLVNMNDMAFLRDLELVGNDNGIERLTVSGLLFVGKKESIGRLLPQAEVTYLHYSEKNVTEYDGREDMKLPIINILDRLTDKINILNKITSVQIGLFRMEMKDFSEAVFQEAILNALAHRDYENMGSIYIKHYPDRIIIESPGGFIGGITEDNIITHPSVPRNKKIAETLQRLKYVQRTGQGVDIIYREMILAGKPFPEYRVYNDSIVLTLNSTMEDISFVKFIMNEQDNKQVLFSLPELMVLRYLTENKSVQISKVQKLIQSSNEEAKRTCNSLISCGLVELNAKSYMLTARVYEAVKSNVEYTRDRTIRYIKAKTMILEYLLKNKSIKNSDVQELCGFTKQQARTTIDKMREENLIEKTGSGKSAKYVRIKS